MTFTVLRYGSTVVVDRPEFGMQAGFHAEGHIDSVRQQVQECDMSDWDKRCVLQELEKCEACDADFNWCRDKESTSQGLFVLCGACLLSIATVLWFVF